ncbi:MAG: cyclic nucleotide-gated ion channel [Hyphomicrobiaceae bacterium]
MTADVEIQNPIRQRAFDILEHSRRRDVYARLLDWVFVTLILANVLGTILQTLPGIAAQFGDRLNTFDLICVAIFFCEYVARLWVAPEHPLMHGLSPAKARFRFALTPLMIIDLIALIPFVIETAFPGMPLLILFRLVRFLKLARYSPALATIGRVVATERRALLACIIIFSGIMLFAAASMKAVEGRVQPEHFGDMPRAIWWAAAMLAKIGGSEVAPVTGMGRIVSAITVMLGIFCFALPVAIIGRGFYEEIHRSDFIVSFGLVARVPLFSDLNAAALADVVGILRARTVPAGTVIIRKGDRGDAMYLIAGGLVEVDTGQLKVELTEGDFFGEMALLNSERRTATVTAMKSTDLLMLDADDFHRLIAHNPEIGRSIRDVASARNSKPTDA